MTEETNRSGLELTLENLSDFARDPNDIDIRQSGNYGEDLLEYFDRISYLFEELLSPHLDVNLMDMLEDDSEGYTKWLDSNCAKLHNLYRIAYERIKAKLEERQDK